MRIRIKERCYFNRQLLHAGDELDLPDGVVGPHRVLRKSEDKLDYSSGEPMRILGEVENVPLFDVLPDVRPGHTPVQKRLADFAAAEHQKTVNREPVLPPEPPNFVQPLGEVRTLTHIEERELRPGEIGTFTLPPPPEPEEVPIVGGAPQPEQPEYLEGLSQSIEPAGE